MTQVTGNLIHILNEPSQVAEVRVAVQEDRPAGTGIALDDTPKVTYDRQTGVVAFDAIPGPAMLLLKWVGETTSKQFSMIIPESGPATLRQCVEAALVADDATVRELERLAAQFADDVEVARRAAATAGKSAFEIAREQGFLGNIVEWLDTLGGEDGDSITITHTAVVGTGTEVTFSDGTTVFIERGPAGSIDTIDQSVTQMAQDAVDVAADGIKWRRPTLTATDNLDNLGEGYHPVPNAATAQALGLPEFTQGEVFHYHLDESGLHKRQYYRADPTDAPSVEYRRTCYNGNWREWQLVSTPTGGDGDTSSSWWRGPITVDKPIDTMMSSDDNGIWSMSSGLARDQGMPRTVAYFVEVISSGTSVTQEATAMLSPPTRYIRRGYNGSWSHDWMLVFGEDPKIDELDDRVTELESNPATNPGPLDRVADEVWEPSDYLAEHYGLVEEMRERIGPVTTGGTGAMALVFDHGTTAVKEWAWEACRARGIPVTMALCPGAHFGDGADSNHQATIADVQGWVDEGMALASHSWDHDGATGYSDIYREIVTSRRTLEDMFGVMVDSWVQPGYALSTGNYDGFGTGQYASNYTDTLAGQLLQRTYPVITGYVGDDYVYPLSPNPVVGIQRSLIERIGTIDTSKAYVQQAIDTGGKHIVFIHPYALAADSSSTYHTRAEFEGFLDWVVQQRDAGNLHLMTLPELSIAAADTSEVPESQTYTPATNDLALSQDTTAGTRVMAGDTMIFGDTGWRQIALINGWTGGVWLRRIGTEVFIRGEANAAAATHGAVIDLPTGFTAGTLVGGGITSYGGTLVASKDSVSVVKRTSMYFNRFAVQDYSTAHTYVLDGSWTTFAAWPSTLPGTPG